MAFEKINRRSPIPMRFISFLFFFFFYTERGWRIIVIAAYRLSYFLCYFCVFLYSIWYSFWCCVQILTGKCFVSAIAQVFEEIRRTTISYMVSIEKKTFTFDLHRLHFSRRKKKRKKKIKITMKDDRKFLGSVCVCVYNIKNYYHLK